MRGKPLLAVALLLLQATTLVADEAPSMELLEFLGSFETAAGQWIDPTELEPPPPQDERETPPEGQEK